MHLAQDNAHARRSRAELMRIPCRLPLGGAGFLRVHPMRIIVAARHAGSPSMRLRKSPAQFPIRPYVFVCCIKIWSR